MKTYVIATFFIILGLTITQAQSISDVVKDVIEMGGATYKDNAQKREILASIGADDPTEVLLEDYYGSYVGSVFGSIDGSWGHIYITNKRFIYSSVYDKAFIGTPEAIVISFGEMQQAKVGKYAGWANTVEIVDSSGRNLEFTASSIRNILIQWPIKESEYKKIVRIINDGIKKAKDM